jgi:hypothetical protein
MLQDIAILTGGQVISSEVGLELKEASIVTDKVSPILLPRYTHGNPRFEAK